MTYNQVQSFRINDHANHYYYFYYRYYQIYQLGTGRHTQKAQACMRYLPIAKGT